MYWAHDSCAYDLDYGLSEGCLPKESVLEARYIKRKTAATVECIGAGETAAHKASPVLHGLQQVVDCGHVVESLTPFDCKQYWETQWTMCSECWSADCASRDGIDSRLPPSLSRPCTASHDIVLDCPFQLKEYAKMAGARWWKRKKKWYAPIGCDLADLNDLNMLPRAETEKLREAEFDDLDLDTALLAHPMPDSSASASTSTPKRKTADDDDEEGGASPLEFGARSAPKPKRVRRRVARTPTVDDDEW